jgi:hypothetical protein
MAEVYRRNGSSQFVTGTQRSVLQLKSFVITVLEDDGSTAIDLQTQDGYNGVTASAAFGAAPYANQLVESIVREVQPLMYNVPSANAGKIHIVVDGHAVDAATLQARIRALGEASSTQRNFTSQDGDGTTTTIDIGGTTVVEGSITVA